jgi:hypothetical protein
MAALVPGKNLYRGKCVKNGKLKILVYTKIKKKKKKIRKYPN